MKTKILAIILILVAVILVSGCVGNGEDETDISGGEKVQGQAQCLTPVGSCASCEGAQDIGVFGENVKKKVGTTGDLSKGPAFYKFKIDKAGYNFLNFNISTDLGCSIAIIKDCETMKQYCFVSNTSFFGGLGKCSAGQTMNTEDYYYLYINCENAPDSCGIKYTFEVEAPEEKYSYEANPLNELNLDQCLTSHRGITKEDFAYIVGIDIGWGYRDYYEEIYTNYQSFGVQYTETSYLAEIRFNTKKNGIKNYDWGTTPEFQDTIFDGKEAFSIEYEEYLGGEKHGKKYALMVHFSNLIVFVDTLDETSLTSAKQKTEQTMQCLIDEMSKYIE